MPSNKFHKASDSTFQKITHAADFPNIYYTYTHWRSVIYKLFKLFERTMFIYLSKKQSVNWIGIKKSGECWTKLAIGWREFYSIILVDQISNIFNACN